MLKSSYTTLMNALQKTVVQTTVKPTRDFYPSSASIIPAKSSMKVSKVWPNISWSLTETDAMLFGMVPMKVPTKYAKFAHLKPANTRSLYQLASRLFDNLLDDAFLVHIASAEVAMPLMDPAEVDAILRAAMVVWDKNYPVLACNLIQLNVHYARWGILNVYGKLAHLLCQNELAVFRNQDSIASSRQTGSKGNSKTHILIQDQKSIISIII